MTKPKRKPIYCPDTNETVNFYIDYLKTEHWKTTRREKLIINPVCEKCGSILRLNIHHSTYTRIGKEKITDLITLCKTCHGKLHKELKEKKLLKKRKTKRKSYLVGSKVLKLTPFKLHKLIKKNLQKGIIIKPIKLKSKGKVYEDKTIYYQKTYPLISLKCKLGEGELPKIKPPKRTYTAFK